MFNSAGTFLLTIETRLKYSDQIGISFSMRFTIFFHLWLKKTPKYFHQPEKSQIKWPGKYLKQSIIFVKTKRKEFG